MNWRVAMALRKSDRRVLLVLLVLLVLVLSVLFLVDGQSPMVAGQSTVADSLLPDRDDSIAKAAPVYYQVPTVSPERFPFDPNTADSSQLLRLGLQPWQVRNVYKYRAAGGVYREKADFARLYGLTAKQYRELEPYIRISADYQPATALVPPSEKTVRDTLLYPVKMTKGETVSLNIADTAALRRVPGIGSYFAKRVVVYRERLGGFVSVDQLDEIENFPHEAKAFLVVDSAPLRRLRINRLSLDELKRHPYINYYQAKAITDHRRQSGPLHSLSELSLLPEFPEAAIRRLEPYIDYSE